jgi:hypothetical protein
VKPQQKITFGEMRASGIRNLLIYCSDYHCSHWTAISGDRWPDDVRLSDLEPRFTCQACGRRGADVRPNWKSVESAKLTRELPRSMVRALISSRLESSPSLGTMRLLAWLANPPAIPKSPTASAANTQTFRI